MKFRGCFIKSPRVLECMSEYLEQLLANPDRKAYAIFPAVFRGFVDSFRGMVVLLYMDREMNNRTLSRLSPPKVHGKQKANAPVRALKEHEESKVLKRIFQCCALNGGIFLFSILIFEFGLKPGIRYLLILLFGHDPGFAHYVWSWMNPFLSIIFGTIWVLPLFLLSKIINCLWFQDIADSAYRYSRGRPRFMQNLSKLIADSLFSILVQALFLMQGMLVSTLPLPTILGQFLGLIHMCMLYSLYAFEYKWFNMGWELHRRLWTIETNWPYFVGFGLPLAILTQMSSSAIINGCLFSILFPFFIVSGNEADPVMGVCDFTLPLFSPVIAISNAVFDQTVGSSNVQHVGQPQR